MFSFGWIVGNGRRAGRPGNMSLRGTGREAWPLPDFEIEVMRSALRSLRFEPHPYLVVGERARIKAGPLAGMEGVLLRKKDNLRWY